MLMMADCKNPMTVDKSQAVSCLVIGVRVRIQEQKLFLGQGL